MVYLTDEETNNLTVKMNYKSVYLKGRKDEKKAIIDLLKTSKKKDAWGFYVFGGDWNGFLKKIKEIK